MQAYSRKYLGNNLYEATRMDGSKGYYFQTTREGKPYRSKITSKEEAIKQRDKILKLPKGKSIIQLQAENLLLENEKFKDNLKKLEEDINKNYKDKGYFHRQTLVNKYAEPFRTKGGAQSTQYRAVAKKINELTKELKNLKNKNLENALDKYVKITNEKNLKRGDLIKLANNYNVNPQQITSNATKVGVFKKIPIVGRKTTSRKAQQARTKKLGETSSLTFEGRVARIKKYQDLDLAHRVAKNITQTTNTLGLDPPIINQVIVKPSETLINKYYRTQKNIGRQILNKGKTKELLKQLDAVNSQIFAESLRTKGRVIGSILLPDQKGGLVSKFVGINPKLSIDFGIFDQDIKSLEKEIGLAQYKSAGATIGSKNFLERLKTAGGNPQKAALFYNEILPSVVEYNKSNPFKEEDLKDLMNTKKRQELIIKAASKYGRKDLIPSLQKIFKRIPLAASVVATPFVVSGTANAFTPKINDKYVNAYANFKNESETEKDIQTTQADEQMQTAQTYDEYPELDNVYASASVSDVPYQANTQPQRTPITEVADVSSAAKMADDLVYDDFRKVFVKRNEPEVKATQSDLLYWLADNVITESPIASIGVGTAGLSIPGAKETFEAARKADKGILRSTASILGKGLTRVGSPAGTALFEVPFIAEQIQEGRSPYDILSDPLNYIGPAFTESLTRGAGAIKGPPRGFLGGVKDTLTFEGVRNPRKAAPGLLNLALRLGLSPRNIALISGTGAIGAIGATALTAFDLANAYRKGELDNLFSSEEGDTSGGVFLPGKLDTTGIMGLKNET